MFRLTIIFVFLLLSKDGISFNAPNNLPSIIQNICFKDILENTLLPILSLSIANDRVFLLGKGTGLNNLEELKEEILSDKILIDTPMFEKDWKSIINERTKWSDLPERIAESLFYRKFADCLADTEPKHDCFLEKKLTQLKENQLFLEEISIRLPDIVIAPNPLEALQTFLLVSLWSMQKSRRLISTESNVVGTANRRKVFADGVLRQMSYLVSNDCQSILQLFKEGKTGRGNVAIILGNTGKELIADLAVAYTLISLNLCESVTFHTKKYTISEYGATTTDVYGHIEHLADPVHSDVWAVRHFGEALRSYVYQGRLRVEEDEYWCLPSEFWDMPSHLEKELCSSRLVIIKGENNYVRLLGNRDWPVDCDSSSVLNYLNVPVCALRIIESQIGCGVDCRKSPGLYGIVQFNGGSNV